MKNGCIVGCGAISPMHAEALVLSDYGKLYGVCDTDPQKAEAMARKYVAEVYSSFEQVIEDKDIDVVHICTPHYLHTPMAKTALSAGKAVVLEKPVAISKGELEDLLAFVQKNGYEDKVTVMFQTRRNTCVQKMQSLLKEDKSLGSLLGIIAHLSWKRDEQYYASGDWRGTWKYEGGGVLINQAIHTIDLMLLLAGPVKQMFANASNRIIKNIEVEDTADVLIEFESGARGVLTATNGHSTTTPATIELQFENGILRYADHTLYSIKGVDIEVLCHDEDVFYGKDCWGNGHADAIDSFYRFLHGEGGENLPLTESVPATSFVFEVYRQAFGRY